MIRTRFAPSPTGFLHIGGLRTALYAYFFAKKHDGQMVLRIEDTDQTRLVPGATEALVRTLHTMGVAYDEGPFLRADGAIEERGAFGPYLQSKRLDVYRAWADMLVEQGSAYHCFCSAERLTQMRAEQEASKQPVKYDRRCFALSAEERQERVVRGESSVIRLLVPEGETRVEDIVYGPLIFANKEIDDQVLIKSDGFPTYHLAVVVDDHLMAISHVLRGEDWLSSTPKQIILYRLFGWTPPTFAHLPNLLSADKKKLSKRQGDVAVEDFLAQGYLPAALNNFVGTLGYNPTGDREIYTLEELIGWFDLSKVNRSGAVVNREKLDWMNKQYIQKLSLEDLERITRNLLPHLDMPDDRLCRILIVEQSRLTRTTEIPERLETYRRELSYDPALLVWKKADAEDAKKQLGGLMLFLDSLSEDTFESVKTIEDAVQEYIRDRQLSTGNVLWPLRVALAGVAQSPGPFELAWIFGKIETLNRLKRAVAILPS